MASTKQMQERAKAAKKALKQQDKVKSLGQVFTPFGLVKDMLDRLDSTWNLPIAQLKWKTILEPSCGNGQFVLGVIRKLMDRYQTIDKPHLEFICCDGTSGKTTRNFPALAHILQNQLYAVELDETQRRECLKRIVEMAAMYGCTSQECAVLVRNNNIIQGDFLTIDKSTCWYKNIKNWGPHFATNMQQVLAARQFDVECLAIDTYFNPEDLPSLNVMLTMSKKAA